MKANTITIQYSVFIQRSPEDVWDYTQNYDYRPLWDSNVLEATVLQTQPERIVHLKAKANTSMTFVYKLDKRPHKTTLATREIQSPIMESGGGSWSYMPKDGGTLWTQTNSIMLKQNVALKLLLPFLEWMFTRQTKAAMLKAKKLMERPQ